MAEPAKVETIKTLDSWKEIAAFLKRGIRTVQRWEKTEGLPVRRHQHLKRGSICAMPSELASWQHGRQTGFQSRAHNPVPHYLTEPFDRLHSLTLQQAVLAEELKTLLSVNQAIRRRMGQLRS